jgi:hypothetical protein
MADTRFHLPLAIGMAHPAWDRDHAVVAEDVTVERVQRRVVDVRLHHALGQVVEHNDAWCAAEPTKRRLVHLRPHARAGAPRQQTHRFPAKAEREDEEPHTPVLPRRRVAHHRPFAPVDLRLLAGLRDDHRVRLRRAGTAQLLEEALHARVLRAEAVIGDEVLVDRHAVAAALQRQLDEAAVRLARARRRRPARRRRRRWRWRWRVGGHPIGGGRFCRPRVGGHPIGGGRFCRRPHCWWAPHRDAGCFEVPARCFPAHAGRGFDPPKRPSESPKRQNLLSFVVAQDVGHPGDGPLGPPPRQRPGALHQLAGFEVSTTGRFWVSPEGLLPIVEKMPTADE